MKRLKKQSWETVRYTENPDLPDIETLKIVEDFLPSAEELANAPVHIINNDKTKQITTKVTVTLQEDSIAFFKRQAKLLNTTSKDIIVKILDQYVKMQSPKH